MGREESHQDRPMWSPGCLIQGWPSKEVRVSGVESGVSDQKFVNYEIEESVLINEVS